MVLSKKEGESLAFKRPEPKLGYVANGYFMIFFDGEEVHLTDEQAAKILPLLEQYQFVNVNGGVYKISNIKKIVPHERKLTEDELKANALQFKPKNHDKFRSLSK